MYRSMTLSVLAGIVAISTQVGGQTTPPGGAASAPATQAKQKRLLTYPSPWVPPPPMASQPAKGAWYEVDESVYSWGDVWEGEPVTKAFKIKNIGTEELEIRDAKADCHCTVPGSFDRRISPGNIGTVPFTFNSTGMQKFVQKGCTITTNDPQRPVFRVYLQGNVRTVVELIPVSGGAFGKLTDPDEIVESRMELVSHVDEPVKLTLLNPPTQPGSPPLGQLPVSSDKPLIVHGGNASATPGGGGTSAWDLTVEEVTPGKKWNVTLTTAPPVPAGYPSYQYRFSTGQPRLPVWTLFASAMRPERICADPPNMLFPQQYNAAMPPQVTIENYGKTPVKVLSAAIENKDLPLEAKVTEVGGKFHVQVTAPPGFTLPGPTNLLIKTDDAQVPIVTVKIFTINPQPGLPPLPPKTNTAPPVVVQPRALRPGVAYPQAASQSAKPVPPGAAVPAGGGSGVKPSK